MATYVISDIHGEYDKFMELLELIKFSDSDTLYILGDILDRGPHPIKVMLKLMKMPNVIPLVGNHEVMAIDCLRFLMKEITESSISDIDRYMLEKLLNWEYNGCKTTLAEFNSVGRETRQAIVDYIKDFSLYEKVEAGGRKYLLVHAGLGNFRPDRALYEYDLNELVWERPDYNVRYFKNMYTVTGHTPTELIKDNDSPGYIYRKEGHIAIDCGACFGGRLAALCLDTDEEFYSSGGIL